MVFLPGRRLSALARRNASTLAMCAVLLVLVGLGRSMWGGLQIYVRVESSVSQLHTARMQAIETMISHRHVALGTAPPAFVLVEYGGSFTAQLVCWMSK